MGYRLIEGAVLISDEMGCWCAWLFLPASAERTIQNRDGAKGTYKSTEFWNSEVLKFEGSRV